MTLAQYLAEQQVGEGVGGALLFGVILFWLVGGKKR